jgi:hypothetical protein
MITNDWIAIAWRLIVIAIAYLVVYAAVGSVGVR